MSGVSGATGMQLSHVFSPPKVARFPAPVAIRLRDLLRDKTACDKAFKVMVALSLHSRLHGKG
jgi:hypothetical protein